LSRCRGCVLSVIVLLEGEPSPQSEHSGADFHQGIRMLSLWGFKPGICILYMN
jgi:hypothetical protein